MPDKTFPIIAVGATLFLVLAVFSFNFKTTSEEPVLTRNKTPFPEISLRAKSVYIYDLRADEEIFSLNPDERLPLASLTKLMAASVAYDLSPDFGTVTVTNYALDTYGDSGLLVSDKWSLKNLLDFSLVTSSNDGMRAVALSLGALGRLATPEELVGSFVTAMNQKASRLDLKNTYFWNETGLDESEAKGGAYGTARDISTLVSHILFNQPDLLEATKELEVVLISDQASYLARNTNSLAREIPGLRASKTGFTNAAGGNLTFVFDPEIGRPIVVTILGSTASGRFEDARKLIVGTLDYLKTN